MDAGRLKRASRSPFKGLKIFFSPFSRMSERDFLREFHFLEICNLGPDSLEQEVLSDTSKKKWEVSIFEGSWVRGATAGGCRNYLDTFWVNPQYFITLEDPDDDDDENNCTLIIDDPDNCPTPLDMGFFKFTPSAARVAHVHQLPRGDNPVQPATGHLLRGAVHLRAQPDGRVPLADIH
ncbi:hypothetical protein HPB48_012463 [Haemaphysalis longicornis]|uniref:Peptidase C2 calpain domain-containing protein n=1 Tax=Haemaphysalis longicornis TaxID=44386 RepID=A0A9J6GMP7_HAELO|nr:hypothetical protein HPB48_012463 [Haemaphysalis longicornis]